MREGTAPDSGNRTEDGTKGGSDIAEDGEIVRMYGTDGAFYAIYRYEEKDAMYHIIKMFH